MKNTKAEEGFTYRFAVLFFFVFIEISEFVPDRKTLTDEMLKTEISQILFGNSCVTFGNVRILKGKKSSKHTTPSICIFHSVNIFIFRN